MPSAHRQIFDELEKITCADLKSSDRLVRLVEGKLALIEIRNVVTALEHDELVALATLFKNLVVDVLSDRYQAASVRCFAHACVALDYLLDPDDDICDTQAVGGHRDDALFLQKTYSRFKREFEAYRDWRARTGNPW